MASETRKYNYTSLSEFLELIRSSETDKEIQILDITDESKHWFYKAFITEILRTFSEIIEKPTEDFKSATFCILKLLELSPRIEYLDAEESSAPGAIRAMEFKRGVLVLKKSPNTDKLISALPIQKKSEKKSGTPKAPYRETFITQLEKFLLPEKLREEYDAELWKRAEKFSERMKSREKYYNQKAHEIYNFFGSLGIFNRDPSGKIVILEAPLPRKDPITGLIIPPTKSDKKLFDEYKQLYVEVRNKRIEPEILLEGKFGEMVPEIIKKIREARKKEMPLLYIEASAFEDSGIKCIRCGGKKVTYTQSQTRGGDEPMTTFYRCPDCEKMWRD